MSLIKKTILFLLVFLLAASPLTALAAEEPAPVDPDEYFYTATADDTFTFTKQLAMKADANVPNTEFSFSVEVGAAIPASVGKLAVLAVSSDEPVPVLSVTNDGVTNTEGKVQFAQGDETTRSTEGKYAQREITVSFAGITFTKPGVYRYIITETSDAATHLGITDDANLQRTLDVYVVDTDGALSVGSCVLYGEKITTAPAATFTGEGKSDGYVNTYVTQNLTFGKTVTGSQGSKDKYFKFAVTISGVLAGTKYDVDLSNADTSIEANPSAATTCITEAVTQPESITVPDDATEVTQIFYLRHGQSITVKGIAQGSEYVVTEEPEEYVSTPADGVEGKITDKDIETGYTNDRSGVIPTGVILSMIPGIILAVIAAAGLIVLLRKKKES